MLCHRAWKQRASAESVRVISPNLEGGDLKPKKGTSLAVTEARGACDTRTPASRRRSRPTRRSPVPDRDIPRLSPVSQAAFPSFEHTCSFQIIIKIRRFLSASSPRGLYILFLKHPALSSENQKSDRCLHFAFWGSSQHIGHLSVYSRDISSSVLNAKYAPRIGTHWTPG